MKRGYVLAPEAALDFVQIWLALKQKKWLAYFWVAPSTPPDLETAADCIPLSHANVINYKTGRITVVLFRD